MYLDGAQLPSIGTAYRYVDELRSVTVDAERDLYSSRLEVRLVEFSILSRTPRGMWIETGYREKRFVLAGARRRYACETVAEARESFVARKRRQASIYRARMLMAEQAISILGDTPRSEIA